MAHLRLKSIGPREQCSSVATLNSTGVSVLPALYPPMPDVNVSEKKEGEEGKDTKMWAPNPIAPLPTCRFDPYVNVEIRIMGGKTCRGLYGMVKGSGSVKGKASLFIVTYGAAVHNATVLVEHVRERQ